MANNLLTISMITKEALSILHNNCVFVRRINKQYSKEFAQNGAKVGNSINIRKPMQYYVRDGQTAAVQGSTESSVSLTLNHQWGTDVEFTSTDLALSLDEFGKRVLSPIMNRITSKIDYVGLQVAAQNTFNCVGTAGTTPGGNAGSGLSVVNAPLIFLNAGMQLNNYAVPTGDRHVLLNPAAMASTANSLSGLYNDQESIAAQYRSGTMGTALGFEFAMSQNISRITTGSRSNANTTMGANATANATTFTLTGLGANATILIGEKFYVNGCNAVNPENGQDTGYAAYFTVTANATANAGGTANVSVWPPVNANSSTAANQTVSALPSNGSAITWIGAANSNFICNLAYHEDAFTLATADLRLPRSAEFASREVLDGISMRVWTAADWTDDQFGTRFDVLGGFAALRPEEACVILG